MKYHAIQTSLFYTLRLPRLLNQYCVCFRRNGINDILHISRNKRGLIDNHLCIIITQYTEMISGCIVVPKYTRHSRTSECWRAHQMKPQRLCNVQCTCRHWNQHVKTNLETPPMYLRHKILRFADIPACRNFATSFPDLLRV